MSSNNVGDFLLKDFNFKKSNKSKLFQKTIIFGKDFNQRYTEFINGLNDKRRTKIVNSVKCRLLELSGKPYDSLIHSIIVSTIYNKDAFKTFTDIEKDAYNSAFGLLNNQIIIGDKYCPLIYKDTIDTEIMDFVTDIKQVGNIISDEFEFCTLRYAVMHCDLKEYKVAFTDDDCISIFIDTATRVFATIERLLAAKFGNKIVADFYVTDVAALKSEITDLNKTIKELQESKSILEKKNSELQLKISILEQNKDSKGSKDDESRCKELSEIVREYSADNAKLLKRYEDLQNKYASLVLKVDSDSIDDEDMVKDISFLDCNLKYAFVLVCTEHLNLLDDIERDFPNSVILNESSDLNTLNNVEMVVLLTRHISHHYYYKVKNYCKKHNISVLHSGYENIDMLKNQMAYKERYRV